MPCVDALSNGIAIGMRAFAFASASILVMLTDIAPFFDEMFTGWRVPFLTSEPGTLGVRFAIPAPSPGISRIRSSAIQVGWDSDSEYNADPSLKSFLFMLKNPHNFPVRKFALKAKEKDGAIFCDSSRGPHF
jgi:hypothetical protein